MPKKQNYRIRNWSDYNKALVKRGSLTLWFDEEAIKNWHETKPAEKRGRPYKYADIAISCMLTIKAVFHFPLRATQGLVTSLIELLELPIKAANYTTMCRRQNRLEVSLQRYSRRENIYVVFDSTGLKVFGEGEWKVRKHGYSKRRTWRKLHLGANEANGEIVATVLTTNDVGDSEVLGDLLEQIDEKLSQVSGDGAYDSFESHNLLNGRGAKITIPPQRNAKIRQHGNCKEPPLSRDEIVRDIRKIGRAKWKKLNGYHRRSIAETTMFRYKQILGDKLSAKKFDNQVKEVLIKCNILNMMASLGMPNSYATVC